MTSAMTSAAGGAGGAPAAAAEAEQGPPEDWRAGGFGVYIHWPFCLAKCPYCDFNSHVAREIDQTAWARDLRRELAHWAARLPGRRVDTLFFGGGTPSLMAPETVAALIGDVAAAWGFSDGAEITLEANPTSVEAGRFRAYADAGVTRLSMGVQALDDAALARLGRTHSAAEARAAFDIARAAFGRVSFDLIYARAGQSRAAWRRELGEALAMAVDHLSLYQLTIEPETRFGALAERGAVLTAPDGAAAAMYADTQALTAAAGLPAYEVSNHAAAGSESRCNLVYWRSGDYVGVGPGAHGRVTLGARGRRATATVRDPAAWRAAVGAAGHGLEVETPISPAEQAEELLLMGLRLAEGVDMARFARLAGAAPPRAAIDALTEDGFLERRGDRIAATAKGRPVLNAVLRALLAG